MKFEYFTKDYVFLIIALLLNGCFFSKGDYVVSSTITIGYIHNDNNYKYIIY